MKLAKGVAVSGRLSGVTPEDITLGLHVLAPLLSLTEGRLRNIVDPVVQF